MRQQGVRAVLEVGEGVYKKVADPEAHHEIEETNIHRYISVSGASEPHGRGMDAGPNSTVGTPSRAPTKTVGHLGRLTEYKKKSGDISSILAWDDLTGMKLDAGKVKEARSKEVHYIHDKRVYDKIPRNQAIGHE